MLSNTFLKNMVQEIVIQVQFSEYIFLWIYNIENLERLMKRGSYAHLEWIELSWSSIGKPSKKTLQFHCIIKYRKLQNMFQIPKSIWNIGNPCLILNQILDLYLYICISSKYL